MGKNIGKNMSKNVSGKDSQKRIDNVKKSATDSLRTYSKKAIQKTAEATGDLIDNKVADRITKISKDSQQDNLEKVTGKHDKEMPNIPSNIYISPKI